MFLTCIKLVSNDLILIISDCVISEKNMIILIYFKSCDNHAWSNINIEYHIILVKCEINTIYNWFFNHIWRPLWKQIYELIYCVFANIKKINYCKSW